MPLTRVRATPNDSTSPSAQHAASDGSAVDAGAVDRQPEVGDVDVIAAADDLGVQARHGRVVEGDVDAAAAADGRDVVAQREDLAGLLHAEVRRVHGGSPFLEGGLNRSTVAGSVSLCPYP